MSTIRVRLLSSFYIGEAYVKKKEEEEKELAVIRKRHGVK